MKEIFKKATTLVVGISLLLNTGTVLADSNSWMEADSKSIKSVSNEVKSLTSNNYSDLEFLKPILKDKTVVCLGENFHRVAEYSSMKTRLIKYLHEELGFNVIAFEAGLDDCAAVYEDINSLKAKGMMEYSLFPIWHSKETLDLFDYIKKQSKTDRPLYLAGYDMQPTSGYFTNFMYRWIDNVDKDYAKKYAEFDMKCIQETYSLVMKYMDEAYKHKDKFNEIKNIYEPKYKELIKFIDNNKDELQSIYPKNPHIIELAKKSLNNRIKFIEMCMLDTKKSYEFRDKMMAENVEWIMNTLYPNKKVILWAHNDHLAKNTSKMLTKEKGKWINNFTSMGELLNKKFKDKEYVLGFYMNSGKASTITTQKVFNINSMPEGSLENMLMNSGYKYTFVDLSKHKVENKNNSWMFNPVFAGEDGMTDEIIKPMCMMFVPKEQYDGIILIDKVKQPTIKY